MHRLVDLKLTLRGKLRGAKRRLHFLKSLFGGDVVIHGSYLTSNVGDISVGQIIQRELSNNFGLSCHLNGCYLWKQQFSRYRLHVIGGGGIIHDFSNHNLEDRLSPIGSAKYSIALGVGVPGIITARGKNLARKLDECEFITVRDEGSKAILEKFISKDVEVTACPSFLLEPEKVGGLRDNETIGVNLRDWFFSNLSRKYVRKEVDLASGRKKYLKYVREQLKVLEQDFDLLFIPFADSDFYFAKKELRRVKMKILLPQSPQKTLDTIKSVNKMICMRYHSLVFSILAETPMFVIDYTRKTRELVDKIKKVNFVPVETLDKPICFDVKSSTLQRVKAELQQRAKKNFQKSNFRFLLSEN